MTVTVPPLEGAASRRSRGGAYEEPGGMECPVHAMAIHGGKIEQESSQGGADEAEAHQGGTDEAEAHQGGADEAHQGGADEAPPGQN